MFHHISKHLKVRQKYSAARCIFNSLLGVWECDETSSLECLIYYMKMTGYTSYVHVFQIPKVVAQERFDRQCMMHCQLIKGSFKVVLGPGALLDCCRCVDHEIVINGIFSPFS